MLTLLKLENFKIWQSTGPIQLAQVTLLLGTNSSGKSSLIQSLLLIRQTVNGDDPNLDLNLGNPDNNDSVTLGQFEDLLCRQGAASESTSATEVGIEFRWVNGSAGDESALFSARYSKGPSGSAELAFLRLGKGGQGYNLKRVKQGIYRLSLATQTKSLGQSADFRPQRSFAFSATALNRLGEQRKHIESIGPALLTELGCILYLGPVRCLAQRDYFWAGHMPAFIGDDGANAMNALIASGVAWQRAKKRNQPIPREGKLFEQTIYWLKEFDLADGLSIREFTRSARYQLLIQNDGQVSNLKDVGVGVSQVLPVIVVALFAKPGHIVVIEEPESHLHPLAQSKLAELFAQVSKTRNVQFIVETHSEHLFRRMQTLIAKQELTVNNAAMYFIERDVKAAKIRALELDEIGRVKNWPDSFFGDVLGETREQTALAIQRAKEMRLKESNVPN